ncbi:MAG: hypothetical protein QOG91_702 [Candidatus Parcubacteria bacterium]|nr:hypothetical protein [Candidatus Parcubacteria bacterium]
MAEKYPDFLALPEPHHHVSRLLVLCLILAVIAALVFAYTIFFMPSQTELTTTSAPQTAAQTLSDAERLAIMNKPSGAPLQNPNLTDAEREALMEKPGSAKLQNPKMTDAERLQIMNGDTTH